MKHERHSVYLMVTCARCGKEYRPVQETSTTQGFPHLMRRPMRTLIGILAASFIIGNLVGLGTFVGSALANGDFSMATLVLSILLAAIILLTIILLWYWRRSQLFSRYCTDCAFEMLRS